ISSLDFGYPMHGFGPGETTFEGLTIERAGGHFWGGQTFPGIWLFSASEPFQNIRVNDARIIDPTYHGVMFQTNYVGGQPENPIEDTVLSNITVSGAQKSGDEYDDKSGFGIWANEMPEPGQGPAVGQATFRGLTLTDNAEDIRNTTDTFQLDVECSPMRPRQRSRAAVLGIGLAAAALAPAEAAPVPAASAPADTAAEERGADPPYPEYEAEDGDYRGTLLEAEPDRPFGKTNFATESSGRKSVRLDSTGEYVEFTSTTATNSIVVRNSIPDAPEGGGQEATLSLYADGEFVQKLTLSSKHSWLYGSTDDPEGLTNTPGPDARRLFDEAHALLDDTYPEGTEFRLQRDQDDDAEYYVVDLIDLEEVAPPAAKPEECTSITEYGAVPDDGEDDTAAIQEAVTANQDGEINCVWIPAGQWRQEQKILTDDPEDRGEYNQVGIRDVPVRGAGMWHSQLYTLTPPHEAGGVNHPHEGNFGFDIDDNTQISD